MRIHHVALRQTGRLFFILSRPGLFTLSTVITRIPASSELLGTSPLPIPNPLPRFSFPLGNFSRDRVWGIPTFPRILIIFWASPFPLVHEIVSNYSNPLVNCSQFSKVSQKILGTLKSASPKFLLSRNIGDKSHECNYRNRLAREFFHSRTCHSAFFQWKIVTGSWYFSAFFYDSYRHRVDKIEWREGKGGLWCNPVQRWTSDPCPWQRPAKRFGASSLKLFTRDYRSIIGGNSSHCL